MRELRPSLVEDCAGSQREWLRRKLLIARKEKPRIWGRTRSGVGALRGTTWADKLWFGLDFLWLS